MDSLFPNLDPNNPKHFPASDGLGGKDNKTAIEEEDGFKLTDNQFAIRYESLIKGVYDLIISDPDLSKVKLSMLKNKNVKDITERTSHMERVFKILDKKGKDAWRALDSEIKERAIFMAYEIKSTPKVEGN